MSFLRANIWCATSQPLTQHVSITINNIKTNIHLQTSRSLNKMKQNMLFVPKIVPAQHYCDLNGKMKVKWVVDKSMMNDLVWVKRQSFPSDAMSFFCYQNPKYISSGGATMKTLEFGEKIHDNNVKLKKV
jgi:hypothetical protein